MQTSKFFSAAVVIMIAWLIMPVSLSAQSIWLDRGESQEKSFAIEILKPNFDGEDNTTFATSAIFLSGRIPVSDRLLLVAELPFAHFGIENFDESDTEFGNPYLGLEIRKPNSHLFAELGFRPPLAPENNAAPLAGTAADFDRFEAFVPDIFTVTGKGNFHRKNASNLVVRLRGGPTLWIDAGDALDETEFFLDYSGQVGYEGKQFSLMGGLTGRLRLWVSEADLDIGERTFHQFGAAASVALGMVRPGIHFRIPLDDGLTDAIDFVFGLHLGVHLK